MLTKKAARLMTRSWNKPPQAACQNPSSHPWYVMRAQIVLMMLSFRGLADKLLAALDLQVHLSSPFARRPDSRPASGQLSLSSVLDSVETESLPSNSSGGR